MSAFDRTAYGPVIAALLAEDRLPALGPGTANTVLRDPLAGLTPEGVFAPHQVANRDMAAACLAGLWLHHGFLDEAHTISQSIRTPTGSYWHGIMHRREPDAANAAYWFRRVGEHPIFAALAEEAAALGLRLTAGRWDPFAFVDQCDRYRGSGGAEELLLRRVQRREWELLFDWCARQARGHQS